MSDVLFSEADRKRLAMLAGMVTDHLAQELVPDASDQDRQATIQNRATLVQGMIWLLIRVGELPEDGRAFDPTILQATCDRLVAEYNAQCRPAAAWDITEPFAGDA